MPPELRDLYEKIGALLTDATNPDSPAFAGAEYRDQLNTIKGQVLASAGATPTKPADGATNWDFVKTQLATILGVVTSFSNAVKGKNTETATALASLPTKIDAGIKSKIDAGELVTKQAATDLAASARKEGEQAGFERGRLLGDRRSALSLAGLPAEVIAAAPEEVLLSEEAKFNAARDAAKDRFTKLQGVGLTVASLQARSLPWAAEDVFTAQHAAFTEIHSAKGTSTNSGTTTPPAQKPNGLAAGTTTDSKPFRFVC